MKPIRLTWTALSLACLVPLLAAAPQMTPAKKLTKPDQEKVAKPELSPAQEDFKRLTAQVQKARMADYKKQREAAKEAIKAGGKIPAMRMNLDLSEYTDGFRVAAKKYAGTDDAIQFLLYTLNITNDDKILDEVGNTLIRDHLKSVQMPEIVATSLSRVSRKLGAKNTERLLDACSKSDSKPLQGAVYFYRGSLALANRKQTTEDKKAAFGDLRKAIELAPESTFAKRAAGMLYEVDHLQIGMKVPDFEGKDTDGVAFKLSDYKGKVILLDFWGDW